MNDDDEPVNPSKNIKQGITKLYGTFTFSGMEDGMKVVFRWDHNGKEFNSITRTWEHGQTGNYWVNAYWVDPNKALPTGTWTLYVYMDGELMQSGSCTIYRIELGWLVKIFSSRSNRQRIECDFSQIIFCAKRYQKEVDERGKIFLEDWEKEKSNQSTG